MSKNGIHQKRAVEVNTMAGISRKCANNKNKFVFNSTFRDIHNLIRNK